jgi:hypothetical protein
MLYHGKGRRLGDYAADTQVVQYNHKNIKILEEVEVSLTLLTSLLREQVLH